MTDEVSAWWSQEAGKIVSRALWSETGIEVVVSPEEFPCVFKVLDSVRLGNYIGEESNVIKAW